MGKGDQRLPFTRNVWLFALGIAASVSFVMTLMVQAIVPALAKVPGLLLCRGGTLELMVRGGPRGGRRSVSTHGICDGDPTAIVGYGVFVLVSWLVWTVICLPLGLWCARAVQRRVAAAERRRK